MDIAVSVKRKWEKSHGRKRHGNFYQLYKVAKNDTKKSTYFILEIDTGSVRSFESNPAQLQMRKVMSADAIVAALKTSMSWFRRWLIKRAIPEAKTNIALREHGKVPLEKHIPHIVKFPTQTKFSFGRTTWSSWSTSINAFVRNWASVCGSRYNACSVKVSEREIE